MKVPYYEIPGILDGTFASAKRLSRSTLGQSLIDLVNVRASQINGCAFCLEMHLREARESGETNERLDTIRAWRDTPYFTDREQAALMWTEHVTLIATSHLSKEDEAFVASQFTETELAELTLAITIINTWNRLNIAFHNPPNPSFRSRQPAHV